jgi:hypothetical protein
VLSLLRQPRSFSLTGSTSTGVNLTATLTIAQPAPGSFKGTSYDISTISLVARNGTALAGSNTVTIWLMTGTPDQVFLATSSDGNCGVTDTATALPTWSAALGQSGAYNSMTELPATAARSPPTPAPSSRPARARRPGPTELLNGIPMVCINSTLRQVATTTESDCIEVTDTKGAPWARESSSPPPTATRSPPGCRTEGGLPNREELNAAAPWIHGSGARLPQAARAGRKDRGSCSGLPPPTPRRSG